DRERKCLDERRGGYCFEQNTLFAAALREIGVAPTTLLGRVRRGPPERWCRTHMVLRIALDGEVWLADVGFGAMGLLEPLPFRDGATAGQGGFAFRLRRGGVVWIPSPRRADREAGLFQFTRDPPQPRERDA